MANSFLKDPVHLKIGESNDLEANKAITQNIFVIRESEKQEKLMSVLDTIRGAKKASEIPKTLIFVARKIQCDDLVYALQAEGYQADSLHGDKSQQSRSITLDRFRSNRVQILVATDVAARGLDVKGIDSVINYDFPTNNSGVEDYVHRIGQFLHFIYFLIKAICFPLIFSNHLQRLLNEF